MLKASHRLIFPGVNVFFTLTFLTALRLYII